MKTKFILAILLLAFFSCFAEAGNGGERTHKVRTFICSEGVYDLSGKRVFIRVNNSDNNYSDAVAENMLKLTKAALEREGAIGVNDITSADYVIHLSYKFFQKVYSNKNNVPKENPFQKQTLKENSSYLNSLSLQDMPDSAKESVFKDTKESAEINSTIIIPSNKGFKEFVVAIDIEDPIVKKVVGSLWVSASTNEKGDTSFLAPYALYLTNGKYGQPYKKWQNYKLLPQDKEYKNYLNQAGC